MRIDAAIALNNQPSPAMKPTVTRATVWVTRKAILQMRQKRFFRAAAILHWPRFVAIAVALGVVLHVMTDSKWMLLARTGYALVAVGYAWMDIYYRGRALEMRDHERTQTQELALALRQRRLEIQESMEARKQRDQ